MAVKLAVLLVGLLGLVVLLGLILLLVRYCKKRRMPLRSASPSTPLDSGTRNFTLDELQACTDDFSHGNLLGRGGFGSVYSGVLPDGKAVAVKRLRVGGGQGKREFETEIKIISRVHHRHVVSLVGYCQTESECILVYELVPNKTLEFHLHGEGQPTLSWRTRMKIALGSAKGLAYLHEDCHPKIIHRDIKAPNILVDNEFEPKIADFGLAKCTSDANSHVSTNVKGTFGYIAPENFWSGNLTEKSDTFSFGVVLLELITGRKPTGMDGGLVDWARPRLTKALEDGNYGVFVDCKLQNNYDNNEMARMVACAAACVRCSVDRRPRMSEIVRALVGDLPLHELNDGITPGRSFLLRFFGGWDCGTSQDLETSRRMPLASQEYGSSHYSKRTIDNGLYPSSPSSEVPSCQTSRDLEMGRMERDGPGFSGGS